MSAVLDAVRRETFGKNEAVRTRQAGKIPAVLYGEKKGVAESVTVDPKELSRILHSESGLNSLISLTIDGAETQVLVKEYQIDPVTHKLIHADFLRVAMDKVIRVTVPVHLTGEAKGVKLQGGTLDFVHRDVDVECLPADIPEHITVDVSELMLNQGVRVKDLATDGTWKAVSEPENLIVHIVAPRAEAAATTDAAAAPAAAAEPEVAKKGKTDKEDK
ncbi:MAG: 50S ribosomal protein L25 [Acidimicrobiia bacterium]|nr:50S ribosomal protein L25 [Acidimicrobiia bacterium]